jgi:bifunctional non-homologous end joining protein LigD
MLARLGPIPTGDDWSFEVKLVGFRALAATGESFKIQSRRAWNMTPLLPELAALPPDLVLDGEIVALENGLPHLPLVRARLMNRQMNVPVSYVVFDVLCIGGRSLMEEPFSERRRQLESLGLEGPYWSTSMIFDDGQGLYDVVCERGLEGIVAKRHASTYQPTVRGWVKTKNPNYWRRGEERERIEWARRKL